MVLSDKARFRFKQESVDSFVRCFTTWDTLAITMWRAFLLVACVLATALLIGVGWRYAHEFYAVDSCLDSSGSFDYSTLTCDHVQNHPYIPYDQRHPATLPVVAVAGIVVASAVFGLRTRKQ
jgi:hypothetical protein